MERKMTAADARKVFEVMIEGFRERGMMERVAEMEIAREYFTTPGWKEKFHEYMWATRKR